MNWIRGKDLGWLQLDHTLAQLQESHSIQLNALCSPRFLVKDLECEKDCMRDLFSEITKRGIVEFIPEVATNMSFANLLLMSVTSSSL